MDAAVFGLGWAAGGGKRSKLNHRCRIMLAGSQAGAAPAATTGPVMPAFGTILDDARVADHIRSGCGNAPPAVDPGAVRKVREELSR